MGLAHDMIQYQYFTHKNPVGKRKLLNGLIQCTEVILTHLTSKSAFSLHNASKFTLL